MRLLLRAGAVVTLAAIVGAGPAHAACEGVGLPRMWTCGPEGEHICMEQTDLGAPVECVRDLLP